MISSYVYQWLDTALDAGISERDFWDMTIAEVRRAVESYERVRKQKTKEQASFDYILAGLIGWSVGRFLNSNNKMPGIDQAYPNLFNDEEIEEHKQEQLDDLSVIRFKQFAASHNKKFSEVTNTTDG